LEEEKREVIILFKRYGVTLWDNEKVFGRIFGFGSTWISTQGLTLARQVLYHMSNNPRDES
jgi:hypothetical protein